MIVLKKAEDLSKSAIKGLKTAKLTPVPGVVSPLNGNTATPGMVGAQATVKMPKPKKMGQATDKPSQFFKKAEQKQEFKKQSIKNLEGFLSKQKAKKKL